MKKILPALMVLLMMGGAGTAWGAPSTGRARNRSALRKASLRAHHGEAIKRLNLSPEQRNRLQAFKSEYRKRVADLNAKIYVKRVELKNEMEKPSPDAEQTKRITEEIGQLKTARDLERLKARKELEKILTPEQSEELKRIEREAPPAPPEPDDEAGD